MARRRPAATQRAPRERARLRTAVLHLGSILGWQRQGKCQDSVQGLAMSASL